MFSIFIEVKEFLKVVKIKDSKKLFATFSNEVTPRSSHSLYFLWHGMK